MPCSWPLTCKTEDPTCKFQPSEHNFMSSWCKKSDREASKSSYEASKSGSKASENVFWRSENQFLGHKTEKSDKKWSNASKSDKKWFKTPKSDKKWSKNRFLRSKSGPKGSKTRSEIDFYDHKMMSMNEKLMRWRQKMMSKIKKLTC